MKRFFLFSIFVLFCTYNYAQITFEKGYYIDNTGAKTDCLIKNIDWKNNPTEFEYKTSENTEQKTRTIESAKEFGIYGKSKYSRYLVDIDRSSNLISRLSYERNPIFNKEQLFLEILVEGKATLFLYEDGDLRRFFYAIDDSEVIQLVYKSFKISDFKISENYKYRQQIWHDLKCEDISQRDIELLDYSKNKLVKLFRKFNECANSTYTNFDKKQSTDLFNLSIRPGLRASALTIDHATENFLDVNFGTKIGFSLGLEAEFIMPFNKNKWALVIEPTYQYYKTAKDVTGSRTTTVNVNYTSFELPIGIRHYMFLNKNSKIFIDGAIVVDLIPSSSNLTFEFMSDIKLKASPNIALGLGYKFNDKFSLELRYSGSRDVVRNWQTLDSDYKAFSVIFGYTIF